MRNDGTKSFLDQVMADYRAGLAQVDADAVRLAADVDWSSDHIAELRQRPCVPEVPVPSDADRLAYYRSHGLSRCDDYPGGDAKFEADVLSGRISGVSDGDARPEDQYVIDRIRDGRFAFDREFASYAMSESVWQAVVSHAGDHGFVVGGSQAPSRDPRVLMGCRV